MIFENVPLLFPNRPYKSDGKPQLSICLSRNYDFVFNNLYKNEVVLYKKAARKMWSKLRPG